MKKKSLKILAAFDFDHTLIDRDSLLPFLIQFRGFKRSIWLLLLLIPSFLKYALRFLSRQEVKERILKKFLEGVSYEELQKKGEEYAKHTCDDFLKKEAYRKFLWHQSEGHHCVIVSASPEFYLIPWGKKHRFDNVLASRLQINSKGQVTGLLEGKNCWGEEKVRRLLQEYPLGTWKELYVYGDSLGDKPLLQMADHPFYRAF